MTEGHAARKLRSHGFRNPIAPATWQTQKFTRGDSMTITSTPGKHAAKPLGLVVRPIMGDTLLHDRLAESPRRLPDIDL